MHQTFATIVQKEFHQTIAGEDPAMTSIGAVRWEWDQWGVVTLVLDDPGRTANMINLRHLEGMAACLDELEHRLDQLTGVVITSAKNSFFSGPDVVLSEITAEENASTYGLLVPIRNQLRRLETLGRPVAAALVGSALGGGLEIALACHYRVGANRPGVTWSLAEAGMGIMPGGGGVVRMTRMFGATVAGDILTRGTVFGPVSALRQGLIDEVAVDRPATEAAARAWVMRAYRSSRMPYVQRWERAGYPVPGSIGSDANHGVPIVERDGWTAEALVADVIRATTVQAAQLPIDDAFAAETKSFLDLLHDPATGSRARLFTDLKAIADRDRGAQARDLRVTFAGQRERIVDLASAAAEAGFATAIAAGDCDTDSANVRFAAVGRATATAGGRWDVTVRIGGIEEVLQLTLYPMHRRNPLVRALFLRSMNWVGEISSSDQVRSTTVAAVESIIRRIGVLPVIGDGPQKTPAPIIRSLVEQGLFSPL
jgi:enoyl-CoA hydratase/carnithine racemase